MRVGPGREALELAGLLPHQDVEGAARHVLGAAQVEPGQRVALVRADEVAIGEEFTGGFVAAGLVADEVDVGARVEAADEERAGHAEQVRGAEVDDAVDDGLQVPGDGGVAEKLGRLVQDGQGVAARVVPGDVLAGHAGDDAADRVGVEIALGPVGEDAERLGDDRVLPVGAPE